MKTLIAVIALSSAVACGKKVEAVQVPTTAVVEPAKVEAVSTETVKVVSGVQSPVVVEVVDGGSVTPSETPAPVVPAPPASPVK
jgi:hypothetical protein